MKIVTHIPHSSTVIPARIRGQFTLSDQALKQELIHMTDWYTDEIFGGLSGATDVIFPVSRLVVDPERFEHDDQEPMSECGMGVVYQSTSDGGCLRNALTNEERDSLINTYYRPHHQLLTQAVETAIETAGQCLVLDGHSFPGRALPYEKDKSSFRPEICIGTDDYHTPGELRDAAIDLFKSAGFSVGVNSPFAGALVPSEYYRSDKRVLSLMIEVRRDMYLKENTAEKLPGFEKSHREVRRVLKKLVALSVVVH